MKAAEIVNELLEAGLDDPEAFLSDYRAKWYTVYYSRKRDFDPAYGGIPIGNAYKTIEQALEKARERKLVKPSNLVWIEQSELPDAPEGVFVSTEKTGAVWDVTPDYKAIRRVTESGLGDRHREPPHGDLRAPHYLQGRHPNRHRPLRQAGAQRGRI